MADIQIPECFYFHGNEIEQFIHVQVPIALIKEKVFKDVSDSAKLLYGLLLNRTGLSIRKGWRDEEDRTYIIYTIENICEDLGIGETKAKKLFSELSNINGTGMGLIKKVRVINRPSRIYVLNFMEVFNYLKSLDDCNLGEIEAETFGQIDQRSEEKAPESKEIQVGRKRDLRSVANTTHGRSQTRLTDSREHDPRTDANATVNNNIDYINNEFRDNNSIPSCKDCCNSYESMDVMERMDITRALIKENIEYDNLMVETKYSSAKIDELIEIMVEACVLMGDVEMNGNKIPHQLIQSRFEKYNKDTIIAVLDSLSANTTDVRNVKKYLLTTLFNAPITMRNQIDLAVMHDLYS